MLPTENEVTRLVRTDATPGAALDSRAIAETVRSYAPDILQEIHLAPPGRQVLVQVTTEGPWVRMRHAPLRLPAPEDPLIELSVTARTDQILEQVLGEIASWERGHVARTR